MSDLMVFENPEFGSIRTIDVNGKMYAVGSDVARALEYARPSEAVTAHCKGTVSWRIPTNGGVQTMNVIPEGDIYRLIVKASEQSRNLVIKKKADRFERWIFDDVIPSVRKHGLYATEETVEKILGDPDFLIATLTKLKEERQRRKELEAQIVEDKPYTEFARSIAGSSDSIHVGDFAKLVCNSGINIGRTRLFRWLREMGYLMEDNKPYQRYIDQGLFTVKENCVRTVRGDMIRFTTLVTGKGQMAMLEALRKEFGLIDRQAGDLRLVPCPVEGTV